MKIGQNIMMARKRLGISQEELANKLEVTRQSISLWETDQTVPTLDKLQSIATILNISLDELTGLKPLQEKVTTNKPSQEEINRKLLIQKEKDNKRLEIIIILITIASVLFWRIGLGIVLSIFGIILCFLNIKNKHLKYKDYALAINIIFLIASIIANK